MKSKYSAIAVLSLSLISPVAAQKKPVSPGTYAAAEKKCDALIEKDSWKSAETSCRTALTLAGQLTDENKPEKMRAYDNYAFTLFSQSKFKAALDNFTKAFEIGRTFLTETDAALGQAYFNLGRANQGLSNLEKAVENYQKAEHIFRAAYEKTTDSELKAEGKSSIRKTLVLQRYIVKILDDEKKLDEIERKLADLEKQDD